MWLNEDELHLQSEEVIYGADDDVDGGRAARLCPQVVLEICRKILVTVLLW